MVVVLESGLQELQVVLLSETRFVCTQQTVGITKLGLMLGVLQLHQLLEIELLK